MSKKRKGKRTKKRIAKNTNPKTRLEEMEVDEVSLVGKGANGWPLVVVKEDTQTEKESVGYSSMKKAPEEMAWDGSAARKRIAEYASSDGSGDKDKIDWAKYRKAFLWYDKSDEMNFGAYKMPIADVVDGELCVVWNAVSAAYGAMQGARGGVDIPDAEKSSVMNALQKYYADFEKEWPEEKACSDEHNKENSEKEESQQENSEVQDQSKDDPGNDSELEKAHSAKPTQAMQSAAQRGLDLYEEFKRGDNAVGRARARQILTGDDIGEDDILEMYAWFKRHEVDSEAEGSDSRGYWNNASNPSAGWIAWLLWGGDAGQKWTETHRERVMAAREEDKSSETEKDSDNDSLPETQETQKMSESAIHPKLKSDVLKMVNDFMKVGEEVRIALESLETVPEGMIDEDYVSYEWRYCLPVMEASKVVQLCSLAAAMESVVPWSMRLAKDAMDSSEPVLKMLGLEKLEDLSDAHKEKVNGALRLLKSFKKEYSSNNLLDGEGSPPTMETLLGRLDKVQESVKKGRQSAKHKSDKTRGVSKSEKKRRVEIAPSQAKPKPDSAPVRKDSNSKAQPWPQDMGAKN